MRHSACVDEWNASRHSARVCGSKWSLLVDTRLRSVQTILVSLPSIGHLPIKNKKLLGQDNEISMSMNLAKRNGDMQNTLCVSMYHIIHNKNYVCKRV